MKTLVCIALFGVLLCCPASQAAQDPQCSRREPGLSPSMHHVMAEARGLWAKKSYAPALKLLDKYSGRNPRHPHHLLSFWQGYLAYLLGRPEAGAGHLVRAVQLWPCMPEAWRNLAVIRMEQDRPAQAAELMLKAHRYQRPPDPQLLYQAAIFYLMAQKPARAVPLLEGLTARPKSEIHWFEALARAHLEMKNYKQADEVVARALALYPQQERLWRTAAWLAAQQGNYKRCAASLQVAYGLVPPKDSGWRQLGDVYRAARVPARAAAAYERAFGAHPDSKELDLLARTYFLAQMPDEALEAARAACQRSPSPKRLAMLGRIHLARRELAQSAKSYQKAAELGGQGGRYWLMAGRLAWRMGKLSRAERQLERAAQHAKAGSATAKEAARGLKALRRYRNQTKLSAKAGPAPH